VAGYIAALGVAALLVQRYCIGLQRFPSAVEALLAIVGAIHPPPCIVRDVLVRWPGRC